MQRVNEKMERKKLDAEPDTTTSTRLEYIMSDSDPCRCSFYYSPIAINILSYSRPICTPHTAHIVRQTNSYANEKHKRYVSIANEVEKTVKCTDEKINKMKREFSQHSFEFDRCCCIKRSVYLYLNEKRISFNFIIKFKLCAERMILTR